MTRALSILVLSAAVVCGCGDPSETTPVEAAEAPPVERSPEEGEAVEAAPSVELTGAVVAAQHQQALRLRASEPARAVEMLEATCEREHSPSCIALADMVEAGEGTDADPERAEALLEQACFAGANTACDRLGH